MEEVHFASCQTEKVCQSEMVLPTSSPSPLRTFSKCTVLSYPSGLLPVKTIGGEERTNEWLVIMASDVECLHWSIRPPQRPTCLTMMMMTMTMTTMMMMAPHGAPQPHMPDDDQGSTVQTPPPIMPLPILYNFHLFSTRPPIILDGIRTARENYANLIFHIFDSSTRWTDD